MSLVTKFFKSRPKFGERVVSDRSGRELCDLRDYLQHDLKAIVYFVGDKRVLGGLITGRKGEINAELREPLLLDEPVSDEALGKMACDALLSFEAKIPPSLRDYKKTDWPAFRASGMKSVKSFERETIEVRLATEYGSIYLDAAPLMTNWPGYSIRWITSIATTHTALGTGLRRLQRAVRSLHEQGII